MSETRTEDNIVYVNCDATGDTITGTETGTIQADSTQQNGDIGSIAQSPSANRFAGFVRTNSKKQRLEHSLIDPAKDIKKQITLLWEDVNVSVKIRPNPLKLLLGRCQKQELTTSEKPILKGVNGCVKPGQLMAILGSSGAGKTTFLNYLTHKSLYGRKFKVSGSVFINGQISSSFDLSRVSAYVQQEDIFIGTLTVMEHLHFHALLRMDSQFSFKQKLERARQVTEVMGLNKCRNSSIGVPGYTKGISGGEKKRLSFATELLTNPMLILADEPTSGLDSYLANTVVECLLTLAEHGRAVMCTIHQPSSDVFSLFSHVMVLSEGRVAYLGEREGLVPYLSKLNYICPHNYNPSDYVINILSVVPGKEETCKQRIETVCDHHALQYKTYEPEVTAGQQSSNRTRLIHRIHFITPFWIQLAVVMWREIMSTLRNRPLIIIRFMQQFVQGVLIGFVYFQLPNNYARIQNVAGLLFLSILAQSFGNTFGVINSFPRELPVFWKEHFSGMYRVWVYFFSKTLSELPFFVLFPLSFAVVVYFMTGLVIEAPRFFLYYLIITLAGNAALSLGYLAGAVSPSLSVALAIGPLLMFPFLIFGGLFSQAGSLVPWLSWIEYLSWFRYSFEALMVNEWAGFQFQNDTISSCFNNTEQAGCFQTGEQVLNFYNLKPAYFWLDIGILFVIIVSLRLLAFIGLLIHTIIRGYI